jgi:hypothetical protein
MFGQSYVATIARRAFAIVLLAAGSLFTALAASADAQTLGTFRWQLEPYCNVVSLTVTQMGNQFRMEGTDDQCGAQKAAPVTGLAMFNPDGSLGFGLTVVTAPDGAPVHVSASFTLPALSGTWSDSIGGKGAFTFRPGAASGGSPRAAATGPGDITAVGAGTGLTGGGGAGDVALSVDPTQVQSRVSNGCPAGQAIRAIGQDGAVTCEASAGGGGDVTSVAEVQWLECDRAAQVTELPTLEAEFAAVRESVAFVQVRAAAPEKR